MASEKFVLCRRETNDFGAPVTYCGKPIKTPNALNRCEGCRKNLPLWPKDEPTVAGVR